MPKIGAPRVKPSQAAPVKAIDREIKRLQTDIKRTRVEETKARAREKVAIKRAGGADESPGEIRAEFDQFRAQRRREDDERRIAWLKQQRKELIAAYAKATGDIGYGTPY